MTEERVHRIAGVLSADVVFRQLTGGERLGQPFLYTVEVLSTKRDLSPFDIIGKTMAVAIELKSGDKRFFHGVVSSFVNVGASGGYQRYEVQLRPWLWLLTHTRDCRIFQQLTVPQIISKVFKDKHGFTDMSMKLKKTYEPREYCVQYRESDLAFVSRLMEQEGIYYYFQHEETKHTLVLVDENASLPKMTGDKLPFRPPNAVGTSNEYIYYWQHQVELQPAEYALRDFDYLKPSALLEARASSSYGQCTKGEHYDYPGSFLTNNEGTQNSKLLAELFDAQVAHLRGNARSFMLATGQQFSLVEHPRKQENSDYFVFETQILVKSGEIEQFTSESKNAIEVEFLALPKQKQFRSPRTTPTPIIAGPQTAIVVGKQGEEIWTDEHGRVKVQFHWDREGKKDESSSCWVRVAQVWAGQGWGSIHVPRIGQEVIVEFLEGDPDRPLITGRVYNADQTPPYDLPNLDSQSGLKSRSTPGGTAETFNELRFDDTKDTESIYFHAERDFTRIVENNDVQKVGFEKKDKGTQTIDIFGDQTMTVGTSESNGSQTLTVYKDQTETIETGNRTITIKKGNDKLDITAGNQAINMPAGQCEITAGKKIILKVGASTITLEPAAITIKSPQVTIEGQTKADIKSTMTSVSGSAVLKLEGGVIKIN